jgi:hypothetical protein
VDAGAIGEIESGKPLVGLREVNAILAVLGVRPLALPISLAKYSA